MNILLIEDDAKTAEFIARGFTQSGFSVTSVDNGTAGLEKLRSESFDIAVCLDSADAVLSTLNAETSVSFRGGTSFVDAETQGNFAIKLD